MLHRHDVINGVTFHMGTSSIHHGRRLKIFVSNASVPFYAMVQPKHEQRSVKYIDSLPMRAGAPWPGEVWPEI